MTSRVPWFRFSLLMIGLVVGPVLAQPPAAQDRAAALKQSLAANQAALRQYAWVETTQISLKGEVKKQEQKQCSYGADGKVQKTPMSGQQQPKQQQPQASAGRREGRVKERIVENKVEDTKEYMEKVAALVHQYVPPDPGRIQAAQASGRLSVDPAGGATTLSVKDYVKAGDSLTIGFDNAANQIQTFKVTSYVEDPKDDPVSLTVTYATLPDATSYPQQTVLDVAAKKIQVTITNAGHRKIGT